MNLKKKFVIGAASLALVAGMGVAPAMAADDVLLPNGSAVTRLDGADRTETSVAAAKKLMSDSNPAAKPTIAYIVGYNAVIDAATAGELVDGVVIVAPRGKGDQLLLGKTMKDDKDLKAITKLVAIGSTGVVPDATLANLKKFNDGIAKTERIDGKNRYETAVNIAKHAFAVSQPGVILLASGTNPVDALAAGAVKNAALLPVNTSGTVDPVLPEFYKSTGATADSVIVLGSEGALADSQVKQVIGQNEVVSPWEYVKTEAQLKEAVQKAAIKYFGQGIWQNQPKALQPDPAKAGYGFFGLDAKDNPVKQGTETNPTKIKVPDVKGTVEASMFSGYKPTYENLAKNVEKISIDAKAKKDKLDLELKKAKAAATSSWKCNAASTNGSLVALTAPTYDMTVANGLDASFKAEYGIGAVAASGAKGVCATNTSDPTGVVVDNAAKASYAWASDGTLAGLNTELVDQINKDATDQAGTAVVNNVADASALPKGAAGSLNALIALKAGADYDASKADKADNNGERVNWFVLDKLAQDAKKAQKAALDGAEAELKAAVAEYNKKPWDKVITQAKGVKRIIGKDRYETSALISYWSTTLTNNATPTGEVYLASGEDMHLIDSVVAGQLTKGSILLVPTKGELASQTKAELARLYTVSNGDLKGFVMGSTGAVSDDTLKAVSAALK